MGLFDTNRNSDDYEGAKTALVSAGGDASKLSSHQRSLIEQMSREQSSRGRAVREAQERFGRRG